MEWIRSIRVLTGTMLLVSLLGCGRSDSNNTATVTNSSTSKTDSPETPSQPSEGDSKRNTPVEPQPVAPEPDETPKPVEPEPEDPKLDTAKLKAAVMGYLTKSGKTYEVNPHLAEELDAMGVEALPTLIGLLSDESLETRRSAAHYLSRAFEPRNPEMVAGFLKLLDENDFVIGSLALQAVNKMKPSDQKTAVPSLGKIAGTEGASESNRRVALGILRELAGEASEAVDAVTKIATGDKSAPLRAAAMNTLPEIAGAEAVDTLRKGLTDPDKAVQRVALAKLWAMEKEAAPAAGDVAALFASDEKESREKAIETLVRIGAPSIEKLVEKLSDPLPRVREHALYTLGKMGSVARPALAEIEKRLDDEDQRVKDLAKLVVERITKGP